MSCIFDSLWYDSELEVLGQWDKYCSENQLNCHDATNADDDGNVEYGYGDHDDDTTAFNKDVNYLRIVC